VVDFRSFWIGLVLFVYLCVDMSSINMSTGVSIEKLDGTNYHVWKFKMQLVLEDKELFGVIDGTDVKAEGSAEWGEA